MLIRNCLLIGYVHIRNKKHAKCVRYLFLEVSWMNIIRWLNITIKFKIWEYLDHCENSCNEYIWTDYFYKNNDWLINPRLYGLTLGFIFQVLINKEKEKEKEKENCPCIDCSY